MPSISLNALKSATGAVNASLYECNGSTGTNIKMSEFTASAVSSLTGTNPIDANSSATYTLNFSGAGSKFNTRIRTRYQNFTWTESHSYFSWSSNQDYTAQGNSGNPSTATTGYIYGKFADGLNTWITDYDTNKSMNLEVSEGAGS